MRCALRTPVHYNLLVEFYLYPTVGTVLIHSVKQLAILSHEDACNSVDPLSSEDVAVVVDSHWFTDCHMKAIFMNTSRIQLRSSITVDGKDVRLTVGVSL